MWLSWNNNEMVLLEWYLANTELFRDWNAFLARVTLIIVFKIDCHNIRLHGNQFEVVKIVAIIALCNGSGLKHGNRIDELDARSR